MEMFLLGALGALAREILRWRKLYLAGRLKKYLNPTYISIAAAVVILAGVCAMVFTPALATAPNLVRPMSFVIGAGFELLVQQAAKLRMPSLPMGEDQGKARPPSVNEFLRA